MCVSAMARTARSTVPGEAWLSHGGQRGPGGGGLGHWQIGSVRMNQAISLQLQGAGECGVGSRPGHAEPGMEAWGTSRGSSDSRARWAWE